MASSEDTERRTERKAEYVFTQACLLLLAAAGFVIAYMAMNAPDFGLAATGYIVGGALLIWPLIRYHERQADLSTGELEVTGGE